ncbi:MAG TPA: RNHCP domain-containing protein [Candidatus Paceibacterota bacterium]|nr:RNHCP domain-containing protein [Candidatus Paceibacterota bacterium]
MSFTRRKEDFVCTHCGARVAGTGYTNHCPKCLWSRHVDIEPGDRAATCKGMMEPITLEGSSPNYRIVHRCTECGAIRRVDVSTQDAADALIALSSKPGIIGA